MAITIHGRNGITFKDNTVQSEPAPRNLTDGTNSTGANLFASRSPNITYTNTLGRPMVWYVGAHNTNGTYPVYIDGVWFTSINGYGASTGGCIIVPQDSTYRIDDIGTLLYSWYEF